MSAPRHVSESWARKAQECRDASLEARKAAWAEDLDSQKREAHWAEARFWIIWAGYYEGLLAQ